MPELISFLVTVYVAGLALLWAANLAFRFVGQAEAYLQGGSPAYRLGRALRRVTRRRK